MNTKELDVAIACETYIYVFQIIRIECFEGGNL